MNSRIIGKNIGNDAAFFVENEDQPCQASWFAVSVETTFFTVSGGRSNALMEALGSVTKEFPQQSYNLK
jgi:hypothetical protein